MKTTDLRNNGPVSYTQPPKASRPTNGTLALILVLALVIVGAVAYAVIPREKVPEPIPGIPQEVVGKNKVLLRDYEDRKWLSYYKTYANMLGDPLFAERPLNTESACVGFTNYLVCWKSDPALKGSVWEFQPMLLGIAYLPPTIQPNDKAELAEIVKDYLIWLEQKGVDRFYWLGTVQSPAYCSQDSNCYQVFQRQVLQWQKNDVKAESVKLSPLGERAKLY